jgi:heme-degrading monooxygenase HmoA
MFSVIFEVKPRPERFSEYLELAKKLKPNLEIINGFVDNERFESFRRKGWLLSHSTWRDEKAVVRWRTEGDHHQVQAKGRSEIFEDYHLRVGDVTSDTAAPPNAPVREQRFDETEVGMGKYATLTEIMPLPGVDLREAVDVIPDKLGLQPGARGLVEQDVFASIYNPGKLALLVSWHSMEVANSWRPRSCEGAQGIRHRVVRVIRDYGMEDRREAPQYYPATSRR